MCRADYACWIPNLMTPYVTLRFYRILFRERGMAGLQNELKPGRTRSTNEEQVAELINTAPRSEPRDPHWSSKFPPCAMAAPRRLRL